MHPDDVAVHAWARVLVEQGEEGSVLVEGWRSFNGVGYL